MEMQISIPAAAAAFPPGNTTGPLCPPPLPLTHRRSISDFDLRFPENINLTGDPFDVPSNAFEKIAAAEGEDLLASFLNLDIFGAGGGAVDVNGLDRRGGEEEVGESGGSGGYGEAIWRSQSVDCLNGLADEERKRIIEPKKAMSADKLAELWIVDPKRAKRIMANRQSAARSKERKARYVLELEKKVQSLQKQATSLSVQHTLFERDTSSLNVENAELRRELEFMEQQAQLRDALTEALESELERLKVATGEKTNSDAYMAMLQQTAYNMSNSFSPSDLPTAKKPNLTKFEPELYPFNQTSKFNIATNIPHQMYTLDTGFSSSCQPMYGIDVGARESWYNHGR